MATEELPPYPQMILRAIEALNSDNGSNKSTISKYIESTYENLPTGHSSLLTLHLNMMKASGELVFWKNNYMKRDPSAAPRRGRGRPPKPKEHRESPIAAKAVKMKVSSGSGKPRGRPRKLPQSVTTTALPPPSGRPRGRPPKVKALLTEVSVL